MIKGIFEKIDVKNVPTSEVKDRKFLHTDKKQQEDAVNTGDVKKEKDIKIAIERIINVAKFFNRKLDLEFEKDLNITVVKVIDSETDKVVRQIPPEEFLELSRNAKDLKGLLINTEG